MRMGRWNKLRLYGTARSVFDRLSFSFDPQVMETSQNTVAGLKKFAVGVRLSELTFFFTPLSLARVPLTEPML